MEDKINDTVYDFEPSGSGYRIVPFQSKDDVEKMPPGLYTLKYRDFEGFSYRVEEAYSNLPDIIGLKAHGLLDHLMNKEEGTNAHALLWGGKGTGKSLTVYHRSLKHIQNGGIVVQVESYLDADDWESISEDLPEGTVIFIDEVDDKWTNYEEKRGMEDLVEVLTGNLLDKFQLIMTSNNRPIDEILSRPTIVRTVIEMSEISQDSMNSILESYESLIPKDIYMYLSSQIKYNREAANSDLIVQCCKLAIRSKDMVQYRDNARLVNAFDGYSDFRINHKYLSKIYRLSGAAIEDIANKVKEAKTIADLLEMNVINMVSVDSSEEPATYEKLHGECIRTINGMVASKVGRAFGDN